MTTIRRKPLKRTRSGTLAPCADAITSSTSDWANLPMELLATVMSMIDVSDMVKARDACTRWREACDADERRWTDAVMLHQLHLKVGQRAWFNCTAAAVDFVAPLPHLAGEMYRGALRFAYGPRCTMLLSMPLARCDHVETANLYGPMYGLPIEAMSTQAISADRCVHRVPMALVRAVVDAINANDVVWRTTMRHPLDQFDRQDQPRMQRSIAGVVAQTCGYIIHAVAPHPGGTSAGWSQHEPIVQSLRRWFALAGITPSTWLANLKEPTRVMRAMTTADDLYTATKADEMFARQTEAVGVVCAWLNRASNGATHLEEDAPRLAEASDVISSTSIELSRISAAAAAAREELPHNIQQATEKRLRNDHVTRMARMAAVAASIADSAAERIARPSTQEYHQWLAERVDQARRLIVETADHPLVDDPTQRWRDRMSLCVAEPNRRSA